MRYIQTGLLNLLLLLTACSQQEKERDPRELDWEAVANEARATTVNMMMWQGDPLINDYMKDYVTPTLKERYDIDLNISHGQGNTVVQVLLAELQGGKGESELDLIWINGETFYQLRQIDALFGPWTESLPNARYIDFSNPFIGQDFQQDIDGYECPWGNVQMTLIYDREKVSEPPRSREALARFVRAHPGKFTFDTQFTGLTFLKALLIDIADDPKALYGDFNEEAYQKYSKELWDYIRRIRPYLWKEGNTFPEGVAPMHQMFANGELWFTMSNNDAEVDNKILQGLFPETARAYVLESGTIQNSHYVGIPKLSGNKAGAMVVANFLISPEAQYRKQNPQVWGDGTVLDLDQLPAEWAEKFRNLPNRRYAPPRDSLKAHALMELAPEYMIRLAEDFRAEVIR